MLLSHITCHPREAEPKPLCCQMITSVLSCLPLIAMRTRECLVPCEASRGKESRRTNSMRYRFLSLLLLVLVCRHEAAVLDTSKVHAHGKIIEIEASDANSKTSKRELEWRHRQRIRETIRKLQEPWPDVFFSTELVNDNGEPSLAKSAPSATQAPNILQPLEHVEEPPIDHSTHAVPKHDDAKFLISFDLSIAVVRSDEASENAVHLDTLTAISSALDTVIVNDTSYELLQRNASLSDDADLPNWKYTLKQETATTTHLFNEKCHLIDSNETIMVTWLQTKLDLQFSRGGTTMMKFTTFILTRLTRKRVSLILVHWDPLSKA